MASEEDASLCTVCQEIYNDPRFLLCGHSFCLQCIKRLAGNRRRFRCPICRFSVVLRDGNVGQLPKNFGLFNVIEAKGMTQPSMCLEHKKILDIYCEGCDMVICSKCLSAQHKGHAIEDIDKIFVERNDKLSEFLETTTMWTSIILERRNVLQQSIYSIEVNADSINKTVDNMFKKWKDDLQEQKNKALNYLQLERDKKLQPYHEAELVFKNSTTNVTSLESEIREIRTKGTTFVIQKYGSVKARKEDTERRVLVMLKQCLTQPDDLKMELIAPWMEEAIANITLTDMGHNEARPKPQKIAAIQRENIMLKSNCERLCKQLKELEQSLSKSEEDKKTLQNNYNRLEQVMESCNDDLNVRIKILQDQLEREKGKQQNLKKQIRENKDKAQMEIFQWKCKYEALLVESKGSQEVISNEDPFQFGRVQSKIENVPEEGKQAVNKKSSKLPKVDIEEDNVENQECIIRHGNEVRDNEDRNPTIADLSDATRPTKLAEIFSELYDNQWTDAFEEHMGSEQDVIRLLLRFLTKIHTKCQKLSSEYMSELEEKIVVIPGSETAIFTKTAEIPVTTRKFIVKIRKSVSEQIIRVLITHFIKEFIPKGKKSKNKIKATALFIEKCTELCWYMAIKDPPVIFGDIPKEGELVNKDLFKPYTRSGKYVDYCVWPPLLLCKNGALLCKGIIQGK